MADAQNEPVLYSVQTSRYAEIDGKAYFGGHHILSEDVAKKLQVEGVVSACNPPLANAQPAAPPIKLQGVAATPSAA